VDTFYHSVFQFRRLPILAILAISYPHPLGLNYDSKGVTAFDPRDFALNRVPISSNRPPIALNPLHFADQPPLSFALGVYDLASCPLLDAKCRLILPFLRL
jgi:hypothetical protein